MGRGLQLLAWGALTGLAAFLTMLVKQKNAALELAQTRLARLEQRMGQLAGAPAATDSEQRLHAQLADKDAEVDRLRAQLADKEAEIAQLRAQLADITAVPAAATPQAESAPPEPSSEMWRQRLAVETGWHAKAPRLVMIGQALDALPPAKLVYANRAVQERIVPEVTLQPQDLSAVAGVGVIYEQRLYNAGIGAYWELATLDDDALRRILKLDKARAATVDLNALAHRRGNWLRKPGPSAMSGTARQSTTFSRSKASARSMNSDSTTPASAPTQRWQARRRNSCWRSCRRDRPCRQMWQAGSHRRGSWPQQRMNEPGG